MTEIINFIATELERALAQGMTPEEARLSAEMATRNTFAGERPYVAAFPKQRRQVQLAKLEKRTQVEMALATGLSVRQVRRIRRGK